MIQIHLGFGFTSFFLNLLYMYNLQYSVFRSVFPFRIFATPYLLYKSTGQKSTCKQNLSEFHAKVVC